MERCGAQLSGCGMRSRMLWGSEARSAAGLAALCGNAVSKRTKAAHRGRPSGTIELLRHSATAATQGQPLTADAGNWNGTGPVTHAYQWQRCDAAGNNCQDIAGATGSTYKVLAPVRVLDTRPAPQNVGLPGPIPANLNKEFKVAGVRTVPASAVAVTGNLTITNQTKGGYATLSTTPPPARSRAYACATAALPNGERSVGASTLEIRPPDPCSRRSDRL